jgi:signal transduction histidine kinase
MAGNAGRWSGGGAAAVVGDLDGDRIVQEALTNALRHADATLGRVRVGYAADAVELEVRDDGRGPVTGAAGHGLVGMRERVVSLGGVLETDR